MAAVKSKNTKPELIVRKELFRQGFRYRLNVKKLPGTPDIVLSKYKTMIFINGSNGKPGTENHHSSKSVFEQSI